MVEFTNTEVKAPSNNQIAGLACSLIIDGMGKVLAANSLNLTKKSMKGWNIYPTSEMRNITNVITQGIKAMTGLIEEHTYRDQAGTELNDAKATLDRIQGMTGGNPQIKVNREELLKHLNNSTDEFVVLNANQ